MNVSVIIRTRDEENNIGNCLEAMLRQSKKPREIIIADNMSQDNTLGIVRAYQKKLPIKILANPILGFASGLELGVKNSKYNYLAFLSADCIPNDDWLLNLTNYMKKKQCSVVQGHEILYPDNIIHYVLRTEQSQSKETEKIVYFNYTNTLCDKEVLIKFLPFQYVGKYLYGEDTLMALDYKEKGYDAYLIQASNVKHNKFSSVDEFKDRVYKHARSSVGFFLKKPFYPRIYLNSFYWIVVEFSLFVKRRDTRYLKVSYWRFISTFKGILSGIIGLIIYG